MASKRRRTQPTEYNREALIRSKRYAAYQPDFLRAVLSKDTYTLEEADKAVNEFFNTEKE